MRIDDLEKAVADVPSPAKYFHLAQAYLGAKNKVKGQAELGSGQDQGVGTERSTSP